MLNISGTVRDIETQIQWNTTPYSTVSFRVTLTDLHRLSKVFDDAKHRAGSLRQLSFLYFGVRVPCMVLCRASYYPGLESLQCIAYVYCRCWSNIGRIGGRQLTSFGRGCEEFGTVLHEMMHTLGFWHEQVSVVGSLKARL